MPNARYYILCGGSVPIIRARTMMKNSFAWQRRTMVSLLVGFALFASSSRIRAQNDSLPPPASSSLTPSSLAPSNAMSTGHSYFGIDAGITGSDYLGEHNFLWGIVTSPSLATYVPFTSMGTGIGFVGGVKVGFALSNWFDLETKVRFMTNHTSRQESEPAILLDTYHPGNPAPFASATDNYAVTLSSVGLALLGHIQLNDWLYGAIGGSGSELTKNGFSTSQQLVGSYLQLNTHTSANLSSQSQPEEQIDNWFYGDRFDAQVGVGAVYRIGASNMLLDAELLVGIPLTQWLTKLADSSINATAGSWQQPPITDPHLWYATLTIGLRLPFSKLPPPVPPPVVISAVAPMEVTTAPPQFEAHNGLRLSGKVTDALTGQPLNATLTAVDLGTNKVIATSHTDSNGNYSLPVSGAGKYSVTATAPGHLFGTALFEVDSEGRILTNPTDLHLAPANAGAKTRLLVFFEFDKSDLQAASMPELSHALDLLKQVPTMKVQIAGYTDSIGTLEHNMDLSLRRANAVRDYLIQQGIAPERIVAKGYGPTAPIATNTTNEGRAKNRRVEFVVEAQ